jgi:2-octaprenyl-6-methoxyphenol hydroxylase
LVWTVNADEQQALMQQNEQRFLASLQSAFGYRLGKLTHVGERACYPLQLTQANASHCHRAVLVGNASQSLHPIAGQGLNLALRDIESLSGLITHFAETGKDIGGFLLTSEYQARRHNDKHSVIGLTDTLVRVFSNDYWPLVIGRNLGLGALNMLPAMKAQLARQAMGMKLSDEH